MNKKDTEKKVVSSPLDELDYSVLILEIRIILYVAK